MIAIRLKYASTTQNTSRLLDYIKDENCSKVVLSASPRSGTDEEQVNNGPDSNFPLLSAVAVYQIPHAGEVAIVMDGNFLNAQRKERYNDVCKVLDAAEESAKVSFNTKAMDFTASTDAEQAASYLLGNADQVPFSAATRAKYFALLSTLSEKQFESL